MCSSPNQPSPAGLEKTLLMKGPVHGQPSRVLQVEPALSSLGVHILLPLGFPILNKKISHHILGDVSKFEE